MGDLIMVLIIVYITCKDMNEARRVSKHLLDKKLIACSNLFPIRSMYKWKNKFCDEKEIAIVAKSVKSKFAKIKTEVKKVHSYDVPCIEMITSKANSPFEDWVKKEVK